MRPDAPKPMAPFGSTSTWPARAEIARKEVIQLIRDPELAIQIVEAVADAGRPQREDAPVLVRK